MRQKDQNELNLGTGAEGEARSAAAQATEARAAEACLERPAVAGPSMEAVLERENLKKALAQVKRNKGSAGVDGMTVGDLPAYLKEHWLTIRAQLLESGASSASCQRLKTARMTRYQAVTAPRVHKVTLSCSYRERTSFSGPKARSGPPAFDNRTISLSLGTISLLPRSNAAGSISRHLPFSSLQSIPPSIVAAPDFEPMRALWRAAPG